MECTPIATVRNSVTAQTDANWGSVISEIILREDLKDGLLGLADFSHALIVTYLHQARFVPEEDLIRRPRGRADMPLLGIFAQRAKDRPNPIGVTAVRIVGVSEGVLTVEGLDAIDGTPVLDIKPYFPAFDRRDEATVPAWADTLMKEYF